MWLVHVGTYICSRDMMNDQENSMLASIFTNRTPTRDDNKKDGFSKTSTNEWNKQHKSNWTTKEKRRENFSFSFLIYEPSLQFRGNKSDTTCLQTLKCHRSIAQLTPIGAVMSSIKEWRRREKKKKRKMRE